MLQLNEIREFFGSTINHDNANMIIRLISGEYDPLKYSTVKHWSDLCYHKPDRADMIMVAVNQEIGGYGVEYVSEHDGDISFEYVNFGDTYSATIVHDLNTNEYILSTWGVYLEEMESQLEYEAVIDKIVITPFRPGGYHLDKYANRYEYQRNGPVAALCQYCDQYVNSKRYWLTEIDGAKRYYHEDCVDHVYGSTGPMVSV